MRGWTLNSKNKSVFLFMYDKCSENKSINT
jgi:hypothetical protein